MSSPLFPGYAEREDFFRPGLGLRVYFSHEEAYCRALQDPDSILDAAYSASLDHPKFLLNLSPSSSIAIADNSSRRRDLLDILIRHGLLPVKDPSSWIMRRAQVLSSRLLELLPDWQENYPHATSDFLYQFFYSTLAELGFPQSVDHQIQDLSLYSTDIICRDLISVF